MRAEKLEVVQPGNHDGEYTVVIGAGAARGLCGAEVRLRSSRPVALSPDPVSVSFDPIGVRSTRLGEHVTPGLFDVVVRHRRGSTHPGAIGVGCCDGLGDCRAV